MDALDRLLLPANDLLSRVDDALAGAGAPAGHPVGPLLSRLRTLPGEAVGAFAALGPAPLAGASAVLHRLVEGYAETRAALPGEPGWHGASADAFAVQWAALAGHLDSGGPRDLVARLRATASYVDAVADWLSESRDAVARTLALVLMSAEAVSLRTVASVSWPQPPGAPATQPAAADIAARVLGCLAEVHDRGARVRAEFGADLGELVYRTPAPAVSSPDVTTVFPL